jgi:predicted RNase H-like nuclease (RuvC/YqgF family)
MAFGLGKLAVLESKLDIYEDLSKEMLDKLERAVSTISENNNKVAIILERHENRIEEGERTNEAIMKLIEKVDEKVDALECKINQLQKFRWMTVGVAIAAVTILKAPDIFGNFLTPQPNVGMIEGTHIHRLG